MGDNSEDVLMRNSVHPRPVTLHNGGTDGTGEGTNGEAGHADDADGFDALNAQTFAPLLSANQYTVRKMAAQALMDVALMMANISQLRTLITAGVDHMEYYYPLLILVSTSLISQIVFAILIFIIWVRESDQDQREEYLTTLSQVVAANNSGRPNRAASEKLRLSLLKREEDYHHHRITNHMNYATMVLVFLITVINMFITGFGIKLDGETTTVAGAIPGKAVNSS
ncbi:uncharacterized protein LOC101856775 [Aplysia californica]|uniref:Uncharacterized protein LOC101856775 n=1 Tax=Aplysia californica TaxID=6500 RepID=A0ABM0JCB8_APLCA|nr:uncharacterized protein LOC101856775 [Aplysia californica]